MPLFGAHMSAAGGVANAVSAAVDYGCETLQLFTKAPSQWAGKPISQVDADAFRAAIRAAKLKYPTVHDSYLINLASPDEGLFRRSIEAFVEEVERADFIGASYLVMHPGAHLGVGEDAGLAKVARALDEVHERCADATVMVLLETTAGQGTTLGHRFEHLAAILDAVCHPDRLGVCLDTCHVFAAGYELASEPKYRATMRAFDRLIGLAKLKAFHVNDSAKPLGSRVDRHAHIGRGCLGIEPFRLLANDYRFRGKPMILETPKGIDPKLGDWDAANLAVLRGLVE